MFCCKNTASFTLNHEFNSTRRSHREGRKSVEDVVSIQPPASSSGKPSGAGTTAIQSNGTGKEDGPDVKGVKEDRRGRIGLRAQKVRVDETEIPSHQKPSHVAEAIRCAILNNQFLNAVIPQHIIDKVVDAMAPCDIKSGEVIIKQGELGDKFFVNDKGAYEIFVNNELFADFDDSRVFGELAVLYNQKRAATIRAKTDGRIWSIDGTVYKALVIIDARFQEEQHLNFLREVKTLNNCSIDKLQQIAKLLKSNFYPTNTVIIQQGDVGDKFFIIKAGKVTVIRNGEEVNLLTESQYFGEKALIGADVRQATCIAEAPGVTCLELSRNDFINYLGDFESFTTKTIKTVDKRRASPKTYEEDVPPVAELERIATIGEGGFGRVMLVKVPNSSLHYALKMLPKIENNSKEQRAHVTNEKYIHKACKSYFIVQLYKTYADSRYLYFLMEACMGGDLFSHMQRQQGRCFSEDKARFISGCILEALAYMHEKNFIYRDLKPENMLIDYNGYIKLADFGFAKEVKYNGTTFTFAGTPEYVAPEVIYNKGHNRAVDYWAFGIFIFELLAGKTPFKSNDPSYMITYGLILKGIDNILFPKQIMKNAASLIKKLCRLTPVERLGCQKGGVNDIRNHKWFQPFKWADLQERKIKSTFKPELENPFDRTFFDDFDEEYPEPKADHSNSWADFDS